MTDNDTFLLKFLNALKHRMYMSNVRESMKIFNIFLPLHIFSLAIKFYAILYSHNILCHFQSFHKELCLTPSFLVHFLMPSTRFHLVYVFSCRADDPCFCILLSCFLELFFIDRKISCRHADPFTYFLLGNLAAYFFCVDFL